MLFCLLVLGKFNVVGFFFFGQSLIFNFKGNNIFSDFEDA